MISTVMQVIWWASATGLAVVAVLFVGWIVIGRESRKSRELYSLYRQVIAARGGQNTNWSTGEDNPNVCGVKASELKSLVVSRNARETVA